LFQCAQSTLSANSHFFHAMFQSQFAETQTTDTVYVELPYCRGTAWEAFVCALKTGEISTQLPPADMYELLLLYDRFQCAELDRLQKLWLCVHVRDVVMRAVGSVTADDLRALYQLQLMFTPLVVNLNALVPLLAEEPSYQDLYFTLGLNMRDVEPSELKERLILLNAWSMGCRNDPGKDSLRCLVNPCDVGEALLVDFPHDAVDLITIMPTFPLINGEPVGLPTDINDFATVFHTFTMGLFAHEFDWEGVVAAGGAVLACMQPAPPPGSSAANAQARSDVDLFVYGDYSDSTATVDRILRYFSTHFDTFFATFRYNVITVCFRGIERTVQLIVFPQHTLASILFEFDMDIVQCAYDGDNLLATPNCLLQLSSRMVRVPRTIRPSRLWKIVQKGFGVYADAPLVPDTYPPECMRYYHPLVCETDTRVQWMMRALLGSVAVTRDVDTAVATLGVNKSGGGQLETYLQTRKSSVDLVANSRYVRQAFESADVAWREVVDADDLVDSDDDTSFRTLVYLPQAISLCTDMVYAPFGGVTPFTLKLCFANEDINWSSSRIGVLREFIAGLRNMVDNHAASLPNGDPESWNCCLPDSVDPYFDLSVTVNPKTTVIWDVSKADYVSSVPTNSNVVCWLQCQFLWQGAHSMDWGAVFLATRIDVYPRECA
jgi:hypothetical protein